ncbi:hypothetical protein WAI85_21715, partial [Acinetobacter baumannii]
LMNRKGFYLVPFEQDDFRSKPTSCVADFTKILPAPPARDENGRPVRLLDRDGLFPYHEVQR